MKAHFKEFWPFYKAVAIALGFFFGDLALLLIASAVGWSFNFGAFLVIDLAFLIACGVFLLPYAPRLSYLEFKKENRYS